jgi:peptide chain release factor 1
MWERIKAMRERFEEIEAAMATQEVALDPARLQPLAKERSQLEPLMAILDAFERASDELNQAREMVQESDDVDLKAMAQAEVDELTPRVEELTEQAKVALLPADPNDDRNVIVEIRAGTGGDEAGLWAADLYRAYTRYAEQRRWKTEVGSVNETASGGFKEIVFTISGNGTYSRLKYESGVHRVQRVPKTETQGRIHTSTATVAVLPEAQEIDIAIAEADIRMDRFHSGGAGGQNVNKVESGVRLTHIPSGIAVACTDERSQLKNRTKAMTILRAKLYDIELDRRHAERSDARRAQVGGGGRSEKIRTYNYPENRVTDHRIGLTMHNLNLVLDGELDGLIDAVATAEQTRLLEEQVA